MAFMDFLLGEGARTVTRPQYSPQQEDLLDQILGGIQPGLTSGLQNLQNILGGDRGTFEVFERPARRAFEEQTLPTIAERFTGTFGPGAQRSSAFGQALGAAGKGLEENLFSRRIGMQSDALSQLLSLLGPALSQRTQKFRQPRQPGFLENLGGPLAQGLGSMLPLLF